MSLQTALTALKTANAALHALIGQNFTPDIFPQEIEMPAARFIQISKVERDYTFAGRPQLCTIRVQVDGIAPTSAERTTLREAIINCFLPVTRVSGVYGGETILDIRTDGAITAVDRLDSEHEAYRATLDFICDFRWSAAL